MSPLCIGIDVGGTFTDVALIDPAQGGCVLAFKIPSTPDDPARAFMAALDRVAALRDVTGAAICHGTTVGTNTLIERRGGPTALVATTGFRDVIEIRRQARPELYTFDQRISPPLVPDALRFEIGGRLAYDGAEVTALPPLDDLIAALRAANPASIAICLLNSYASSAHEIAVAEALRAALPGIFVTVSSDLAPEAREYERTSTAVVNAYIGPAVSAYIGRLESSLSERGIQSLTIVKSSGGLTGVANAVRQPVHLVESGPAAALVASARFGAAMDASHVLAFDMGGTTAKAGIAIDGEPRITTEFNADALVEGRNVGGYPILSTVLDLVEIGAGGGSIAWLDEAGVLKVGPRSAGARPGPACYGFGGSQPTVTDAHAVIGTLVPAALERSGIRLDIGRAVAALDTIAQPRGWTVAQAAHAVIDIAVARMAEMVRLATLRRGLDPRDFVMVPSGGAGPLHAAAIAAQVGISRILVPPMPGMFSALGAAIADMRHDVGRSVLRIVPDLAPDTLAILFEGLSERLDALLAAEPMRGAAERRRFAEMRFRGQLFELRMPLGEVLPTPPELDAAFRAAYTAEYGLDLAGSVPELVAVRMVAVLQREVGGRTVFTAPALASDYQGLPESILLLDRDGASRAARLMGPGETGTASGPAVVLTHGATIVVPAGCTAMVEPSGAVTLTVGDSA